MSAATHDPVTGRIIPPGKVFARDGQLCFESLQSQNAYYKMLEQGFVVEFELGRPVLKPGKMERVWELSTSEGNLAYLSSRTTLPPNLTTCTLLAGRYQFQALAPELGGSIFAGTNRRKISVKLEVFAHNGAVVVDTSLELTAENMHQKLNFQLAEKDCPALCKMQFHSPSMINRLMVKASIEKTVASKRVEQMANSAIDLAKRTIRPGEFLVELEKDAVGVGMTFKWDTLRAGAAVKSIDPVGVASRARVIKEGDIVRSVQGVRVDQMEFKEIQQLLRNVPMRVILVLEHAPANWQGFQTVRPALQPPPLPERDSSPPERPHTRPTYVSTTSIHPPPPPLASSQSTLNRRPPPPPLSASPSVMSPLAAERALPPPPRPEMRAPPPPPIAAPPPVAMRRPPSPPVARPSAPPAPPSPAYVRRPAPSLPVADTGSQQLERYNRMKHAGLSEPVILQAMAKDGVQPPAGFFSDATRPVVVVQQQDSFVARAPASVPVTDEPAVVATAGPEGSFGPQYVKYERMKKSGLPDGAVVNAMNRDQVAIPAGFFGAGFVPAAPVKLDLSKKSAQPQAAGGGGGGDLVNALNGFNASSLKHPQDDQDNNAVPSSGNALMDEMQRKAAGGLRKRDPEPAGGVAATPSTPMNPLMAEMQKKAAGGLRKRTQEEIDAELESRREKDTAEIGKNLFNVALMKKFENVRPADENSDDDDDDDEWEM
ncbi:hypothetical protein BASA81_002269 [Batrachochytrium salamandrivorans]|nr:hypothetical protein BASA81_002269 [Batrachochytrium salamandrivorans]